MANINESARKKTIVVALPTPDSIARLIGAMAGVVFTYTASLVGPMVYERWKAEPTWHGLKTALASIGAEGWLLGIFAGVYLLARWVERRLRNGVDQSLLDDRLLMTQFGKIALRLADGIQLTKGKRVVEQRLILNDLLNTLYVGCKEVEDVRIVFYLLNPTKDELDVVEYVGNRTPLGSFESGTDRGDDALTFVTTRPAGSAELIVDTKKEKRKGWSGSGNGYRTYISAVVGNASGPIGMLSIDAKNPHTLSHADKHYASMAASLLAIAYTSLR